VGPTLSDNPPMACRLDRAVIRGAIDNRTPGRTTGRIWLLGRPQPLQLQLDGDCWRDVAGTLVEFVNRQPQPCSASWADLDDLQRGSVGDITISRRLRVAADPASDLDDPDIPTVWVNSVSIEWFSASNGRVLIESADFALRQSPSVWRMDADEEMAQRLANLQAMRDHMALVLGRNENDEEGEATGDDEADEFVWEERLKESDRLAEAYEEVLEKYADDPAGDQKEAFAMGWDGLLGAMADEEESEEDDDLSDPLFDSEEDGAEFGEHGDIHPLQARAHEVALRAMDTVHRESDDDSAASRMVANLLQVSCKLAGALNGISAGYQPETGFVLAVLKRCLQWLNDAIAACNELLDQAPDDEQHLAFGSLRLSTFELREEIVALRRELQQR